MHVAFSSHASSHVRLEMLGWLRRYKGKIVEQHPHWLTRISTTSDAYFLDVQPTSGPKDALSKMLPFTLGRRTVESSEYV